MRHSMTLTVLLIMLAGCAAEPTASARAATSPPPPQRVTAADLTLVRTALLADGPLLAGSLTPHRQAVLRAETAAPVATVAVRVGDSVRAGSVLVTLRLPSSAAQLAAARGAMQVARERLALARLESERTRALLEVGGVSRTEADAARLQVLEAEGALAEAEARLAEVQQLAGQGRVLAPFSGVVLARHVQAGDVPQPGDPLVTIADASRLEFEADVADGDLGAIRRGQRIDVAVSGHAGMRVEGVVARIAPAVDSVTRQLHVTVQLVTPGLSLPIGAFAEGRLRRAPREALVVPEAAVEGGATPHVTRLRAGRTERVSVATAGPLVDGRQPLRGPLAPGDTLLVGPLRRLAAGLPVAVER